MHTPPPPPKKKKNSQVQSTKWKEKMTSEVWENKSTKGKSEHGACHAQNDTRRALEAREHVRQKGK